MFLRRRSFEVADKFILHKTTKRQCSTTTLSNHAWLNQLRLNQVVEGYILIGQSNKLNAFDWLKSI